MRKKDRSLHFHIRGRILKTLSPKWWRTRDDVVSALGEQLMKFPDMDGLLQIVPCIELCKEFLEKVEELRE